MVRARLCVAFLAACLCGSARAGSASAGVDPFDLLERAESAYDSVTDYTAVLRKQEKIAGELRPEETIFLKFKRPFKVYMRWLEGPHAGRQAIYVQGAHGDKFLVHETGILARFFVVALNPDGPHVREESRFPVTEIGIGRLVERLAADARRAWRANGLALREIGKRRSGGMELSEVEATLSERLMGEFSYSRIIVGIDAGSGLPVKASFYDWDGDLVARYSYEDVRLNPGLAEAEFDPANPDYGFPGWRLELEHGH